MICFHCNYIQLTWWTADINPIGGISKTDLKKFIAYAQTGFNLPILKGYEQISLPLFSSSDNHSFLDAVPTAELEPISETYVQSDEVRPTFLASFCLIHDELPGGHGHDLRRAISFWTTPKNREMWTLQHLYKAHP